MPGPTTESLDADLKQLRGEVHQVAVDLATVKAEVGLFKWGLGLVLVVTLSTLGSSIWWASATNTRLGVVESRLDRLDASFDRLEAAISKAIAAKGQAAPR